MTVHALIFSISKHLHVLLEQLAVRNDTVCVTAVTCTLPTKRNFLFLMRTKFQMAFDQEPSKRSRESHEVLYGSVTLYCVTVGFSS